MKDLEIYLETEGHFRVGVLLHLEDKVPFECFVSSVFEAMDSLRTFLEKEGKLGELLKVEFKISRRKKNGTSEISKG